MQPLNVRTLDQVVAAVPPQFVIDPFLPRGGVAIIGGEPKASKSLLAMQCIVEALQGKPVFKTMPSAIKRAVYFNAEGGFWVLRRRSVAYGLLTQAQLQSVQVCDTIVKLTLGGRVIASSAVDAIVQQWQQWAPDIMVFDPLVYYHNAEENDNGQMAAVFEAFGRVATRLNCGVLLVHHIRKPSQDATRVTGASDLRGAGHIFGAVDSAATITKPKPHQRTVRIESRHADEVTLGAVWQYPVFRWQ